MRSHGREEIGEVFDLFKGFVARHRPQLDIEAVATGETWYGEDALERKLADSLQVRSPSECALTALNAGPDVCGRPSTTFCSSCTSRASL